MKSAVILFALVAGAYGYAVREVGNATLLAGEETTATFLVEVHEKNLFVFKRHRCNGVLIDPQWVLVPAQCLTNKFGNLEVSIETTDYKVVTAAVHDNADNIANDIALLYLASPVPYTDTVKPINLPFPLAEFSADSATLYTKKSSTDQVQVANVDVKSRVECTDTPRPVSFKHICAGDKQTGAVKGDLGSALAVSDGLDGHVLIGLLSFAKEERGPGVFSKVSVYTDWILEVLEKY